MGKINSRSNVSSITVSFGQNRYEAQSDAGLKHDKTQVMNEWKNFYKDKRRTQHPSWAQHRGRRMGHIFDFLTI